MNLINSLVINVYPDSPATDPGYAVTGIRTITTFFYFIPLLFFLFYVKLTEKRSWASMGFVRNRTMLIYMLLIAVILIGGMVLMYINKSEEFRFMALDGFSIIVNRFCNTVAVYGFLLISLTNRMSMKNAVIVIALLPLAYLGSAILVASINQWDPLLMAYHSHMAEIGFTKIIRSEDTCSIYTTLSTSATITSIFFSASCALLLLRTNHIWGVMILSLSGVAISRLMVEVPSYFNTITPPIVAAAILYAVLFWPKKTLDKQEGAGFVSQ